MFWHKLASIFFILFCFAFLPSYASQFPQRELSEFSLHELQQLENENNEKNDYYSNILLHNYAKLVTINKERFPPKNPEKIQLLIQRAEECVAITHNTLDIIRPIINRKTKELKLVKKLPQLSPRIAQPKPEVVCTINLDLEEGLLWEQIIG